MIRVFPRRTKWTPDDKNSFCGHPPLWVLESEDLPVRVSCTFTDDIPRALALQKSWQRYFSDVRVGGPAFDDPGSEFVPGRFLKPGVTITSRGCIRKCGFCLVPKREGKLRELPIKDGWIVQDNNLLACSEKHLLAVFEMLQRQPYPADFAAGLDSRLLRPWHWRLFNMLKPFPRLHFACDSWEALEDLRKVADIVGSAKAQKFCYALIGYNPDETMADAEKRLRAIWDLGFYPFAMLYRGPNGEGHKSREWKQFQRTWCRPAAYKTLLKETQ